MSRTSLRRELIIPIALLFVGISVTIAWVSMKAGTDAVRTLSERVLFDMVNRVDVASERHLENALTALESVAPNHRGAPTEHAFSDDMTLLEDRMWAASGLFADINNYVYYGGEDGRFVGVCRNGPDSVELYLRTPDAPERQVYDVTTPGDRSHLLRTDQFDARRRPWYQLAMASDHPVWSDVYNDFTSGEPTITLAKAVYRGNHSLLGVAATDVTLRTVSEFLRKLDLSKNSVAYIVDAEGLLVATSGEEAAIQFINGYPRRRSAREMTTRLISETYSANFTRFVTETRPGKPMLWEQELQQGMVDVAVSQIGGKQGLRWYAVIAAPRSDFMSAINQGFFQSVVIAIACTVIALILGLTIVERVVRDILKLTAAAEKFGNGEPLPPLDIQRRDEIGVLASTLVEMENKLRFDKLTQVANREALFARINLMQKQVKLNPEHCEKFTLLFVDLDRFKQINDTYGHHAGDQVLVIIAARLRSAIRDSDEIARYGGDEFVLLLKKNRNPIDIDSMVEKIVQLVEEPIALEDVLVSVGASIGWAEFPEDGVDYIKLLKIADSRMYRRKNDRKSGIHLV